MKNLLIYGVLFIMTMESHAQITLKKYDEPNRSGVRSIVFESQEIGASKKTVEFDIQQNNPYNKLPYKVMGTSPDGSSRYMVDGSRLNEIKKTLRINDSSKEIDESANLSANSSYHLNRNPNYAVVAYNFEFLSEGEAIERGRVSTLIALNKFGEEIFKLENIQSDAYDPQITENGKYVSFFVGEALEHSTFQTKSGIKIYNTQKGTVHYEEDVDIHGAGVAHGLILITVYKNNQRALIVLDERTGDLYEYQYMSGFRCYGYNNFSHNGRKLTFNDLTRIK